MMASRKTKQERIPNPPDGGYGWLILIACFLISFIIDGCMYSFGIILGDIKTSFGVSQEKANLLASLNTGFLFCSGPIVSGLTAKLGIRPVVMGGAVITSLCYVLSAYSPSIYIIMVSYGVIGGITTGCTYIASIIIVAQYFDKLKGIATGVCMAGSGVGAFAFAKIAQFLLKYFDWQYTMVLLGAVIMECCLLGALLRPVPTKPKPKNSSQTERNVETFSGSVLSLARINYDDDDDSQSCCSSCLRLSFDILKEMTNLSLLKKNMGFLFITLANLFLFSGFFLPYIYIPIRAKELNIDGPLLLGIMGILNIPARLVFGFLADARYLTPVNLHTLCIILATGSLWSYSFLTTFPLQCAFAVAFAIGTAGMNCLTTSYLNDIVGMKNFSNGMGILNLFRGFGCFLGPFVGGFISDKFGNTLAAFWFAAITFSVGCAFTILVSLGSKCKLFKPPKEDYLPTSQN